MRYVFTSANFAYQDKVRVLAQSIKRNEPEVAFVWFVVEDSSSTSKALLNDLGYPRYQEVDEIVPLSHLPGPGWEELLLGKSVVEACTAIKGAALQLLLLREDADSVVYLDPDIQVFSPLTPIWQALRDHHVVVTPHLTEPARSQAAIEDNEIAALRHGVYNLGFLAVRNSAEGRRVANWWAARLQSYCINDPSRGLFTDQRWFDLAIGLFPEIGILRHPGCNVASWNIENRHITFVNRIATIGNLPVIFVHYSSVDTQDHLNMTKRYAEPNSAIFELSNAYRCSLIEASDPEVRSRLWTLSVVPPDLSPKWRLLRVYRSPIILFLASSLTRFRIFRTIVNRYVPSTLLAKTSYFLRRLQDQEVRKKVFQRLPADAIFEVSSLKDLMEIVSQGSVLAINHFGSGGAEIVLRELLSGERYFVLEPCRNGSLVIRQGQSWQVLARIPRNHRGSLATWLPNLKLEGLVVNHALGNEDWLPELQNTPYPLTIALHDRYWLSQKPFVVPGLTKVALKKIPGVDVGLNPDLPTLTDNEWRAMWSPLLGSATRFLAPSSFIAQEYRNLGLERMRIGPPPGAGNSRQFKLSTKTNVAASNVTSAHKIACIDAGVPYKGSSEVTALAVLAWERNLEIEFHVFGDVSLLADIKERPNLFLRGRYPREILIDILRTEGFALALFPTRAPESYCLALDDVVAAGLVPVARSVGALKERVWQLGYGFLWDGDVDLSCLLEDLCAVLDGKSTTILYELAQGSHDAPHFPAPKRWEIARTSEPSPSATWTRYGHIQTPLGNQDLIHRQLSEYGEWAFLEAQFVGGLLETGARILDGGSFLGTFSLGLGLFVDQLEVVAIEANSTLVASLTYNLSQGKFQSYQVKETIIAPIGTRIQSKLGDPDNCGSTRFLESEYGTALENDMSVLSLSQLWNELGPFELIKLDIEGWEYRSLREFLSTTAARPNLIYVEVIENQNAFRLFELLVDSGYQVYFYSFPAFNPENWNGNLSRSLSGNESALVGTKRDVHLSPDLHDLGCDLFQVLNTQHLKKLLFETPRWLDPRVKDMRIQNLEAIATRSLQALESETVHHEET